MKIWWYVGWTLNYIKAVVISISHGDSWYVSVIGLWEIIHHDTFILPRCLPSWGGLLVILLLLTDRLLEYEDFHSTCQLVDFKSSRVIHVFAKSAQSPCSGSSGSFLRSFRPSRTSRFTFVDNLFRMEWWNKGSSIVSSSQKPAYLWNVYVSITWMQLMCKHTWKYITSPKKPQHHWLPYVSDSNFIKQHHWAVK